MGMPSWRSARRGRPPGTSAATRSAPAASRSSSGCAAARCWRPRAAVRREPAGPTRSRRCGHLRPRQRRLRPGAEVPARLGDRVPAAPRRDRDERAHAARGGRRDVRPGGRRVRALLGGPVLARPPLREDALRQRAARARVPARLAGDRRPAVPTVVEETLDWALREMRGPEGGFLRLSTRTPREEGKFYVWSVEEMRAALGDLPTPTRRSPGSAPPTAATSRAATSPCAGPASPRAATSGGAGSTTCAPARLAGPRRQAAHPGTR